MRHDRLRGDDAIRAPAEAVADAFEERRLAAASAAPARELRVSYVTNLLGRRHTQTDDAVVDEAAPIDKPGHQAAGVRASAGADVAGSSSGAS